MKKIAIEVHMENDKCRSKAMKMAAAFEGVHSVSLEGENRDQVVVTGDGIDCVCLTNKLRKKFSHATLVSVADANASNNKGGGDAGEKQKTETTDQEDKVSVDTSNVINPPPPVPLYQYHVVYDPYPSNCFIL
ncbi:hypothetical protein SESBI_38625 [Sesbania bispinosa]|nr:hypothetical protein SESBI_38625 [Sesbania bispinosa]